MAGSPTPRTRLGRARRGVRVGALRARPRRRRGGRGGRRRLAQGAELRAAERRRRDRAPLPRRVLARALPVRRRGPRRHAARGRRARARRRRRRRRVRARRAVRHGIRLQLPRRAAAAARAAARPHRRDRLERVQPRGDSPTCDWDRAARYARDRRLPLPPTFEPAAIFDQPFAVFDGAAPPADGATADAAKPATLAVMHLRRTAVDPPDGFNPCENAAEGGFCSVYTALRAGVRPALRIRAAALPRRCPEAQDAVAVVNASERRAGSVGVGGAGAAEMCGVCGCRGAERRRCARWPKTARCAADRASGTAAAKAPFTSRSARSRRQPG